MPGFINFCLTVRTSPICHKTLETKPNRQTDSQFDRKQSSKWIRGCLGWFIACLGMLDRLRLAAVKGTDWLGIAFSGNCQNVPLILHVLVLCGTLFCDTSRDRNGRKWITVWLKIWLSHQSSECFHPNGVGQPVGGLLPSKSEKLWYASLLHCDTQSRSFSEWL